MPSPATAIRLLSTLLLVASSFACQVAPEAASGRAAPSLTALPRLPFVSLDHDGVLSYQWEGCFVNTGRESLHGLEISAVLSVEDAEGHHLERPGKPRRHTPRSGIPELLSPGAFFCTILRSGRFEMENGPAPRRALAWVELRSEGERGSRRPFVVFRQELKPGDWEDGVWDVRAVVSGGPLKSAAQGGTERLVLPDPSLVHIARKRGTACFVKTFGGTEGWLPRSRVVAVAPVEPPPLDAERRARLERLLADVAAGRLAEAVALFSLPVGAAPSLIESDLKRRYTPLLERSNAAIELAWLDAIPLDDRWLVSYFVRWKAAGPGGETGALYDTLLMKKGASGWSFLLPVENPQ